MLPLSAISFFKIVCISVIFFLCIRVLIYVVALFAKGLTEDVIVVDLYLNDVKYACTYWSERGGRPYQEDRYDIQNANSFSSSSSSNDCNSSMYAVYDGHGGSHASQYCKTNMLKLIGKKLNTTDTNNDKHDSIDSNGNNKEDVGNTLADCFRKIDEDFESVAKNKSLNDGTTAITAVIHNNFITVANAGDSRCILIQKGGKVKPLSYDHKPSRDDEVMRIRNLGGKVIYWGRWRVQGILAVSRAIGDVSLKPYITAEPEIEEKRITDDDMYVVLASDGLWDVMTNEDCASFILSRARNFKDLARALCYEAMLLGSADNVTVLIIDLKNNHKIVSSS